MTLILHNQLDLFLFYYTGYSFASYSIFTDLIKVYLLKQK